MKEKFQSLRPAISAFAMMLTMSMVSTVGFFTAPVCQELGIGRGEFTLYYSLMIGMGALTAPMNGRLLDKFGARTMMILSAVWGCGGFFLLSMATELWMLYIIGIVMGIFASTCVSLCASVLVQTSYPLEQASGMLGVVMASSSLGSVLMNMLIPNVIAAVGWRSCYRIISILWITVMLLSVAVMGKPRKLEHKKSTFQFTDGMTRAQALRSPQLYLVMLVNMILGGICGLLTQMPSLLSGLGFAGAIVGLIMSFESACAAGGKILQGYLYGRIGLQKGGMITIGLYSISFLLMFRKETMILGLVCFAIGTGTCSTYPPLVARQVFGSREYASIWSVVSIGAALGNFIGAPLYGIAYDFSGSYSPALVISTVLAAAALLIQMWVLSPSKKAP